MFLALSILAYVDFFNPTLAHPLPQTIYQIPYKTVDSETLYLDVFEPQNVTEPTPAVVYVHGGGWFLRDRTDFYDFALGLGVQQIAGVTIDFRGLPPNGFYDQIKDIKDAVRWVRLHAKEYNIDPKRIGIVGSSSGAHLAALVATAGNGEGFDDDPPGTDSSIQSAVLFEGIYDLLDKHKDITKLLFWFFAGGPRLFDAPGAFYTFSPMYKIDGSEPPCMMVYGTEDDIVPKGQAQRFAKDLRIHDVPAIAVPYPGPHGFNQLFFWTRPYQMALTLKWFQGTL